MAPHPSNIKIWKRVIRAATCTRVSPAAGSEHAHVVVEAKVGRRVHLGEARVISWAGKESRGDRALQAALSCIFPSCCRPPGGCRSCRSRRRGARCRDAHRSRCGSSASS
eukprot:766605-Hanusia_phi.AAC.13